MKEAQADGEALGVRSAGGAAVGEHRTSILQDLELGRPMEIDALVGAVQQLDTIMDQPTPTPDRVLALVKQRARLDGCY